MLTVRIAVLEKENNSANAAFEAIIGKELAGVNAKLTGKKSHQSPIECF